MKILSIVGARPQFVKAAMLSRLFRIQHSEIILHTGQHYDINMSETFFKELGLAEPDINLNIGSGPHGAQTGAIMAGVEKTLLSNKVDIVVVYGDTNSTVGGAIASAKLHIPVAHVEAGLRSFNRKMPEELNRIITDHISNILLCPNKNSVNQLAAEGITDGVFMVGDVMADALNLMASTTSSKILDKLSIEYKNYILATVHRAENTNDMVRLKEILSAFNDIDKTIVFPVHPRTKKILDNINYSPAKNVCLIEPVGYLDMVTLQKSAFMIMTDSGGIQKEAYMLGVPCLTLREETEWIDTVSNGWNQLVGANKQSILNGLASFKRPEEHPPLFGDGNAAEKCLAAIEKTMDDHQ